jgi:alpha-D-ribose 1-methylphosphonate 5-triphosphate synthase subunit PhnH
MSKPLSTIDDIMHPTHEAKFRLDVLAAQILVIDEMLARMAGPDRRESLERPGLKPLNGTGHHTLTLSDGTTVAVLVTEYAGEYIAQAVEHDEGLPTVSRSAPAEALVDLREALEARG